MLSAQSINSLATSAIEVGDLAVSANGVHVLAYLGNQEWIQAEPGVLKVIALTAPDENIWMKQPVHIMRWTHMKEAANNALNHTSKSRAEARSARGLARGLGPRAARLKERRPSAGSW